MQVFIPYSSTLYVAQTLDRRRLNKQIVECLQIQAVLRGRSTAWQFHPIMAMYRNYVLWLEYYLNTLVAYRNGNLALAATYSENWYVIGGELRIYEYGRLKAVREAYF